MLRCQVPIWTTRLKCRAALSHRLGFDKAVGDRLLAVDVLAGFAGGDERDGVPVVGRGDDDGVNVLLLEQSRGSP